MLNEILNKKVKEIRLMAKQNPAKNLLADSLIQYLLKLKTS